MADHVCKAARSVWREASGWPGGADEMVLRRVVQRPNTWRGEAAAD